MQDLTPYFPQFRSQCAPLGAQAKRAYLAADSPVGLAALFAGFFPGLLIPAQTGAGSRRRQLPRCEVFWAFLSQVLRRGTSCRWALTRLQAAAVAQGRCAPHNSTSAYCQARRALSLSWLQALFAALARWFEPRTTGSWYGRTVRIIDGTGFSMPDTPANHRRWPYGPCQKPGCGFPTGKLVGLFCLHSGRLLSFATGAWKDHDLPVARRLLCWLHPQDVLVADRAFCGWPLLALLQQQKTDFVIRLHQVRLVRSRRHRSWREVWDKPQRRPGFPDRDRLPAELIVRLVRFRVGARGFRTKSVIVVTSLLDETSFPDYAIAQLYARRWQVELHFRQIKANLSLDILRGLTPEVIERELWMHAIAYNLVRALVLEAALTHDLPTDRLSFKGALDSLLTWADRALAVPRHRPWARLALLARLAADQVPLRPGRNEPRSLKRRGGHYSLLSKPRHLSRLGDYRKHRYRISSPAIRLS